MVVQSIVGDLAVKASLAQPKPAARPPTQTATKVQGWRWSVDRGTQSAAVGWHQQNGAGRQAREDAWVRQDRTGEATWIVLWTELEAHLVGKDGWAGPPRRPADNSRRIRRTPRDRRTARHRAGTGGGGQPERCKANDPALRQRSSALKGGKKSL